MRIVLAGQMAVESDGVVVDGASLGGRQVRLVLAYLVMHRRRSVSRQELVEVLWPEEPPATWSSALRGVMSQVRSVLVAAGVPAGQAVSCAQGGYRVHLPADVVVDVEVAESAVQAAEQALQEGDVGAACEQALRVRRHHDQVFVVGDDGPWVVGVRADMRGRVVRSLEVLSDARAAQGRLESAVQAAQDALAVDNLQETAHRRLMRCHASAGNRSQALRCYEGCRTILAEELGVRPSPETEALYLELLGREPATPAGLPPGPAELPFPPGVLARTSSMFVGRRCERSALEEAWEQARSIGRQVVVVAGETGSGKTALAVQVGAALHAQGATVLYGRCDRETPFAYEPFAEAVGRHASALPRGRVALEGPAVPELAALALEQLHRAAETSTSGDDGGRRGRLFPAVASFLSALAEGGPVVLVLDDMQWACTPTLQLLRHLLRRLETAHLLVVANYRDEDAGTHRELLDTLADLRREPGVRRLTLGGLDEVAVGELAWRMTGELALDDEPSRFVGLREETGGNPLFVVELVRHRAELKRTGRGAGAALCECPGSGGIPDSIREIVDRRRARLTGAGDLVLTVASLGSEEFRVDDLEAASGLDQGRILDALHETCALRLTSVVPSSIGRFRFANAIVRSTVRSGVSASRRAMPDVMTLERFPQVALG